MNRKTLLTSLLLLSVSIVSYAQSYYGSGQYSVPSKNEYLLKDPLWYISVSGGAQVLSATDDDKVSFNKRVTAAPMVSIGRRFGNLFGLRLSLSGGSLHGFNDGDAGTYERWHKEKYYNANMMTFDPQWNYMGWEEGKDYYFDRNSGVWRPMWGEDGGFYMQHLRYVSLSLSATFNLMNLINGYEPYRRFEVFPYAGLTGLRRFAHMGTLAESFTGVNFGINANYYFSKRFGITTDLRAMVTADYFDGQHGDMNFAGIGQWTLGVTYRFGEPKYIDPSIESRVLQPYNVARSTDDNMVLVPGGNIELGTGIDPFWGDTVPRKLVAVSPFWMDETEVTNSQYREFVYWVRDSIIRERLSDPAYGGDPTYKVLVRPEYSGRGMESGAVGQRLNWDKPIPWKNPTPREQAAISSVVGDASFGAKGNGTRMALNYKYDWFDSKSYYTFLGKLRQGEATSIVISKDTAYVNSRGDIIRETLSRMSRGNVADFTNTYIVNVYPDVYSWMTDFANAKSEQYALHYFTAKAYDKFPVVGVSWEAADAYCAWRTQQHLARYRGKDLDGFEGYRLPTEAEWEFAARNGRSELDYSWYSNQTHTSDGLAHSNYRGSSDLKDLVSPAGTFLPNRFGLFDMAGNVAEWTSTNFTESVDRMTDEANPDFSYRAVLADPAILKRKIVKGGSWKDATVNSGDRSVEYQDKGRSFIGFRCVRSWGVDQKGRIR